MTEINTDSGEDFDEGRSHGHKPKTRKDIATGLQRDPAQMVRLVRGPDGALVADILGKLPGRGIWVGASRDAFSAARKQKAFARAAKSNVSTPDDLEDFIEERLKVRLLGLMGMGKKAGALEVGFDNVRSLARSGKLAYRIEASGGAEDGRGKIRAIAKSTAIELEEAPAPVIGLFDDAELGGVLGRDHLVHMGMKKGKIAKSMHEILVKLSGFTPLFPQDWPDKVHEPEYCLVSPPLKER